MRGRLDVREIEDVGDAALSYNEVKALATGNPLLLDKAEADSELARLQRAERAHYRNLDALRYKVTAAERSIDAMTERIGRVDAAIARRLDTRGDAFVMTVDGHRYVKRHDAGLQLIRSIESRLQGLGEGIFGPVSARHGDLAGFEVVSAVRRVLSVTEVDLALDGVPGAAIRLDLKTLRDGDPGKLVTRLENRAHGLEGVRAKAIGEIDRLRTEVARAGEDLARPFAQVVALVEARERVARIEKELEEAARTSREQSAVTEAAATDGRRTPVLVAHRGFPSTRRRIIGEAPASVPPNLADIPNRSPRSVAT